MTRLIIISAVVISAVLIALELYVVRGRPKPHTDRLILDEVATTHVPIPSTATPVTDDLRRPISSTTRSTSPQEHSR
jgi:hypothetical protein